MSASGAAAVATSSSSSSGGRLPCSRRWRRCNQYFLEGKLCDTVIKVVLDQQKKGEEKEEEEQTQEPPPNRAKGKGKGKEHQQVKQEPGIRTAAVDNRISIPVLQHPHKTKQPLTQTKQPLRLPFISMLLVPPCLSPLNQSLPHFTRSTNHHPPPPPHHTGTTTTHTMVWYMEDALGQLTSGWRKILADPFSTLLRPDQFYLKSEDPLGPVVLVCLWLFFLTALLGAVTQEYSWVDRIWSLTPPLYCWLFALHPFLALGEEFTWEPSLNLVMASLTTLWGLRLTYNFWRKGGYTGMEDYRWAEVKAWFHPWAFQVFNVVFIAFFQNVLLFLLATPCYFAFLGRDDHGDLGKFDFVFIGLLLFFLAMETVADQQQWNFQTKKHAALSTRSTRRRASVGAKSLKEAPLLEGEFAQGFIQSGLFRYSRHPNFFAEISIWWVFHLFTYPASGVNSINWTIGGPLLLTLLFQGSTNLTEKLSARKYKSYKVYQRRVSRLVPWFPKEHED